MEVAIKTALPTFCRLGKMSALTELQKRQDLCVCVGGKGGERRELPPLFRPFTTRRTELFDGGYRVWF